MTDLSKTIAPKSDQLNSDDLISGPLTIKITRVSANEAVPEQPINISYDGDNGKPYRPCKSMRRVLVHVWGKDGSVYAGRTLTLYRDPDVQFGGLKVGGTRISHMSHIDGPQTLALTATRAARKPYTVRPFVAAVEVDQAAIDHAHNEARTAATGGIQAFTEWWQSPEGKSMRDLVKPFMAELKGIANEADITPEQADPFGATDEPTKDAE